MGRERMEQTQKDEHLIKELIEMMETGRWKLEFILKKNYMLKHICLSSNDEKERSSCLYHIMPRILDNIYGLPKVESFEVSTGSYITMAHNMPITTIAASAQLIALANGDLPNFDTFPPLEYQEKSKFRLDLLSSCRFLMIIKLRFPDMNKYCKRHCNYNGSCSFY